MSRGRHAFALAVAVVSSLVVRVFMEDGVEASQVNVVSAYALTLFVWTSCFYTSETAVKWAFFWAARRRSHLRVGVTPAPVAEDFPRMNFVAQNMKFRSRASGAVLTCGSLMRAVPGENSLWSADEDGPDGRPVYPFWDGDLWQEVRS